MAGKAEAAPAEPTVLCSGISKSTVPVPLGPTTISSFEFNPRILFSEISILGVLIGTKNVARSLLTVNLLSIVPALFLILIWNSPGTLLVPIVPFTTARSVTELL